MGAHGGLIEGQAQPPGLLRGQHRGGSGRGDQDDSFVFDQDHQRAVPAERIVAADGPARFSHRSDIGSGNGSPKW
jgi:hypothetical protein